MEKKHLVLSGKCQRSPATPWACQIIPKGGNAFEAYHSISTSVPVGLHYFHFQWNFPLAERAPLNLKRGLGHPGNRKLFWTLFIAPTTLWTSERSKFTKSSDGASRELILLQVQTWFFFLSQKYYGRESATCIFSLWWRILLLVSGHHLGGKLSAPCSKYVSLFKWGPKRMLLSLLWTFQRCRRFRWRQHL